MVPYGDPIWVVDSVFENYIEWVSTNEYNTKG